MLRIWNAPTQPALARLNRRAAPMDMASLDTALALSLTLCGIAGSTLIGLVAMFYMTDRRVTTDV
jgi:hypothetical protein